jgi:hypothetical protein
MTTVINFPGPPPDNVVSIALLGILGGMG